MTGKESHVEREFRGFYLPKAIDRLARRNRAGYLVVSILICAIPLMLFNYFGLEGLQYHSLLAYVFLFFLLILSRWGSNVLIRTREDLMSKAKKGRKEEVANRINRIARRYVFNPGLHVALGLAFLIIAFVTAYGLGHLEWMLAPSSIIIIFLTGMSFCLFVGVVYIFHVMSTKIIGEACPVTALDPDRMGGFKFLANAVIDFVALASILFALFIAGLLTFTLELFSTYSVEVSLTIAGLGSGIVLGGYVYIIFDMHKEFVEEKQRITEEISPVLTNAEQFIGKVVKDISKDIESSEHWQQVSRKINPYSLSILSLKLVLDEARVMRDWPIDIPMVLKLIGGFAISLLVVALKTIIQTAFGIPLP